MGDPRNCYAPNTNEVAYEVLDGEAVLINLSNGMYYSIEGVGGRIWELMEEGHSLKTIRRVISAFYEMDEQAFEKDLTGFVEDLIAENLVVPSEKNVPEIRTVNFPTPQTYASPKLNIYRDMGDLLALDPPMPGLKDIPWKESTDTPSK